MESKIQISTAAKWLLKCNLFLAKYIGNFIIEIHIEFSELYQTYTGRN